MAPIVLLPVPGTAVGSSRLPVAVQHLRFDVTQLFPQARAETTKAAWEAGP